MKQKALTFRQPWAWAVVYGGKPIDNRVWNTNFRGEFLIHAGLGMTLAEYKNFMDFAFGVFGDQRTFYLPDSEEPHGQCQTPFPTFNELERGGIIGKATLVDVLPRLPAGYTMGWNHDWRFEGNYGFVLNDVQALPFQKCSGARKFWEYDYAA